MGNANGEVGVLVINLKGVWLIVDRKGLRLGGIAFGMDWLRLGLFIGCEMFNWRYERKRWLDC